MPNILFFLDDVNFLLTDKALSISWLKGIALEESKKVGDVNIILTSDIKLLKINQDFLKHDYFTDIITFQNEGEVLSGEIYISLDRVRENAKISNSNIENELHRVMAHGFLHMIGYKDKSEKDKKTMRAKEEFYLNLRS